MGSCWVFPYDPRAFTVGSLMRLLVGFTMRSLVRFIVRFLMRSQYVPRVRRCFPRSFECILSHGTWIIPSSFHRAIRAFHCTPRVFPALFLDHSFVFLFPCVISPVRVLVLVHST